MKQSTTTQRHPEPSNQSYNTDHQASNKEEPNNHDKNQDQPKSSNNDQKTKATRNPERQYQAQYSPRNKQRNKVHNNPRSIKPQPATTMTKQSETKTIPKRRQTNQRQATQHNQTKQTRMGFCTRQEARRFSHVRLETELFEYPRCVSQMRESRVYTYWSKDR